MHQGRQERAVLAVLVDNHRRVVGRRELARQAGLAELSDRRCDSVLVGVRRMLGPDSIVTVRSRGWMIAEHAMPKAVELLDSFTD
ncbi:MAG: helix-turn-helix domain-containing protein [Actinobacteria bacterium]|jgi:DNA-binding response OmpR family regulator|nr:helix-turn-helix domain-containing protein [Actinomycetota bacterium]